MGNKDQDLAQFWNRVYESRGHTGYSDPLKLRYDQPLRLAAVSRIISKHFPGQGELRKHRALDIGCGTGDVIALLRGRNAAVTGLDISPRVIEGTRKRFAQDTEVTLLSGSVVDVSFPESFFDAVTSVTVLQHIVDDDEVLAVLGSVRSCMKPHGKMIVLELAPMCPVQGPASGDPVHYLKERPVHVWRNLFAAAGFTVIDEPVMPQLGITMLRGLGKLVDATRRSLGFAQPDYPPDATTVDIPDAPGTGGVMRAAFQGLASVILLISWTFDHALRLPLPPSRYRSYRIFVLKRRPEIRQPVPEPAPGSLHAMNGLRRATAAVARRVASVLKEQPAQLEMVWPEARLASPPECRFAEGYRLRAFAPEDRERYFELLLQAGMPPCPLEYWNNHLLPGGFFVVEHEDTGDLVATCMASHHPASRHPYAGNLGWLAAAPPHAGRNLGYAVSAAVTLRLLNAGYRRIYLTTDDSRLAALRIYLRMGWVPLLYQDDMPQRWKSVCESLDWPYTPHVWAR